MSDRAETLHDPFLASDRADCAPDEPGQVQVRPRLLVPGRYLIALGAMALALLLIPFTNDTYDTLYKVIRTLPNHYITACKQLANPFTITMIVCCIGVLDRRRRPALVALLVAIALASAANMAIKTVTQRARPTYSLRLHNESSNARWIERYNEQHPGRSIRSDGRDAWLWFSFDRFDLTFSDKFSSFPSGHSCAAFALAAFLVALYPRGRWIWLLVAVGCALARVAQRRHFPEDILFGSGLGWLVAQWVLTWHWPTVLGQKLFGLLRTRPEASEVN